MGSATSTVMESAAAVADATSLYMWGNMSEVSLSSGQNRTFILKCGLKFIYMVQGDHYKISPDSTWTTDKLIPAGSILKVFKIFRHGDGHVQIFASFNDETGLYDVSCLFDAISPLKEKNPYLYTANNSSPYTLKPQSIYDSNTVCGMPIKPLDTVKNLSYSKSV
jgi:hypothetical protein